MSLPPDHSTVAEAATQTPYEAPSEGTGPGPSTATATAPARPRVPRQTKAPTRRTRSATPPASRPTLAHAAQEDEDEGFFKRYGVVLLVGLLSVAGGGWLLTQKSGPTPPPMKQERMVMIAPLPPLPPPPPPPPKVVEPPKPQEKMEKETAAAEEAKPDPKPEPAKAPEDPAPIGTGLKGDGPGLAGLGSGSGIGGGTLGGSGGGKGGSRFGWYAGQVQSKIAEALRKHPKTKSAGMRVEVRIWPDSTGRITRAQLAGSSGDAALDDAIKNGVLTGLQLQEPPPAGMKLPIVLRLTAQRQTR